MNKTDLEQTMTQNEYAEVIARETLKVLSEHNKKHGNAYVYSVVLKFLGYFTEALLEVSLNSHLKEKDKKVAYTKTQAAYNAMKLNVQNQVGEAFSRALSGFSKQPVDYYCTVKPTPQPLNTKPC